MLPYSLTSSLLIGVLSLRLADYDHGFQHGWDLVFGSLFLAFAFIESVLRLAIYLKREDDR